MERKSDEKKPGMQSDKKRSAIESDNEEDDASAKAAEEAMEQQKAKYRQEDAANSEKAIRAIEELHSQYRADPEATSKLHILDCINEICRRKRITPYRAPRLSAAIYSTLQLVLDGIAYGDSTLSEEGRIGLTPLHLAMQQDLLEGIELLLTKGAGPAVVRTRCEVPAGRIQGHYSYTRHCAIKRRYNLIKSWKDGGKDAKSMRIGSFSWGQVRTGGVEPIGMNLANIFLPECHGRVAEGLKMWIHVPVTSTVASLIDDHRNEGKSLGESPFESLVYGSFHVPAIVPSNPLLSYRDMTYETCIKSGYLDLYKESAVVVLPCLILDTIERVLHERRVHETLKPLQGCDHRIMVEDVGICLEQTIDESYYPSLDRKSLEARNKDQVVSKEFLRTSGGSIADCPILMVPQLWLWRMDNVLLSACSETNMKERWNTYLSCPLSGMALSPLYRPYAADQSINCRMGLLLAESVNNFGMRNKFKGAPGTTFTPPLDMFEAALISTLSAVHNYLEADRTSLKTKEQKSKELEFIHHVSDIHSELDMIQVILNQQKEVMDKFLADTQEERDAETRSWVQKIWEEVVQARQNIDQYTNRINKIHKDAERAEKTIDSFLNLQRTYANIEDTQNNMLVGLAALAFAIVTVIFTPLSFMTSLFALPVREILQHQKIIETSTVPTPAASQAFDFKYIGGYIALAGVATWIPTGILLGFLYLRWTGHFGRRQSKAEPKKDDATDSSDTDAKETERPKSKPWVPLRDGLRHRWNALTAHGKNRQAQEGDNGVSTGVEDSEKEENSKITPQVSDAEGSKGRKKDTSIV